MVEGDVASGLWLCRAVRWNQTGEDWKLFLKLSPEGCRVAVDEEGQVRGTVATVRYDHHFSWIGMVLVDPAMQRQGIGIQLLRESLQVLSEEETVKLDATPAGRKIYVQLDFVDEYPISRMEGKDIAVAHPSVPGLRLIRESDMPAVVKFDRQVFGADRQKVLTSLSKRALQFAFLSEDANGVNGYCFGRKGHYFSHIGPVVGRDVVAAKLVASAALQHCAGSPVVIDALHHTPEWREWLASLGFREQRPLIRMYRGTNAFPGIPGKQFAILGPEFG